MCAEVRSNFFRNGIVGRLRKASEQKRDADPNKIIPRIPYKMSNDNDAGDIIQIEALDDAAAKLAESQTSVRKGKRRAEDDEEMNDADDIEKPQFKKLKGNDGWVSALVERKFIVPPSTWKLWSSDDGKIDFVPTFNSLKSSDRQSRLPTNPYTSSPHDTS